MAAAANMSVYLWTVVALLAEVLYELHESMHHQFDS